MPLLVGVIQRETLLLASHAPLMEPLFQGRLMPFKNQFCSCTVPVVTAELLASRPLLNSPGMATTACAGTAAMTSNPNAIERTIMRLLRVDPGR